MVLRPHPGPGGGGERPGCEGNLSAERSLLSSRKVIPRNQRHLEVNPTSHWASVPKRRPYTFLYTALFVHVRFNFLKICSFLGPENPPIKSKRILLIRSFLPLWPPPLLGRPSIQSLGSHDWRSIPGSPPSLRGIGRRTRRTRPPRRWATPWASPSTQWRAHPGLPTYPPGSCMWKKVHPMITWHPMVRWPLVINHTLKLLPWQGTPWPGYPPLWKIVLMW